MDKQLGKTAVAGACLALLAGVGVGCSDDGGDDASEGPACVAAQDFQDSLAAVRDAEPGDLGAAAEEAADSFDELQQAVGSAREEELSELQDQVGDLVATADSGDTDELEDALTDIQEAWLALLAEIKQVALDCGLETED
jgi:hypothetical protein